MDIQNGGQVGVKTNVICFICNCSYIGVIPLYRSPLVDTVLKLIMDDKMMVICVRKHLTFYNFSMRKFCDIQKNFKFHIKDGL